MGSIRMIMAFGIALALTTIGCATRDATDNNAIEFVAKSYPVDGPATCALDDGGSPLPGLKRIRSVDERTVVFELCAPDAALLSKLALVSFGIDDSGYLSSHGADGTISRAPNGTGPFALSAWEDGTQIVLKRNDSYWGDTARTGQLIIQFQNESTARLLALQAGLADGTPVIGVTDEEAILSDPNLTLLRRPPLTMSYIAMSNRAKPFDDVRVRKAVALSIDRQRIVDQFYPTGTMVAHSFVPCAIKFGCAGEAWYDRDLAEAKALLAEAGFPDGFDTTIIVRDLVSSHTPYPEEIAQDLQDQLLQVGIRAKIEVLESTTWVDRLISGENVGLGVGGGWVSDYPDPTNYLDFFFRADSSGSARFGEPYAEVSSSLAAAAQTFDEKEREALYERANNAIKAEVPMIPVVQTGSSLVYRSDVAGANSSPLELESLAVLQPGERDSLVWLMPSEPASLYCQGGLDVNGQDPLRVCSQIYESLYGFETGSTELIPRLATECRSDRSGRSWTCTLREGVTFHDGSSFDATDVVDSFAVQWDCAHPWRQKGAPYVYMPLLSPYLNEASCASQ